MSNDEKTSPAPASTEQVNNKEVEEKEVIAAEEPVKATKIENNEAATDNGKTAQQVDSESTKDGIVTPAPEPKAGKPAKLTVKKTDFEKDVVYLYQFSRTKNTPSPSSFCLKVETWLRMAGIKYEVRRRQFSFSLFAIDLFFPFSCCFLFFVSCFPCKFSLCVCEGCARAAEAVTVADSLSAACVIETERSGLM